MDLNTYHFNCKTGKTYTVSLVHHQNYEISNIHKINQFLKIHHTTFIDAPTEEKEVIIDRLQSNGTPITFMGICENRNNSVIGGYMLEVYKETGFVLLTYIFVKEKYRKKNIGSRLIDSIEYFYKHLFSAYLTKSVDKKAIFFEIKSTSIYSETTRYGYVGEFFTKKGSLWIDIKYIEPLSESDQYFLGAIPVKGNNLRENLFKSDIEYSLRDFYFINKPGLIQNEFVNELLNTLKKKEKIIELLKEFPKLIIPKLKFTKASISFHITQTDKNLVINIGEDNRYCKVFNSFEKDLFAQNYIGDNTPYFSKHIDIREIGIKFKNTFHFNSEGREETFIITDEAQQPLANDKLYKEAKVYLNHTYFRTSEIIIWEVVIHPIDYFNEYELIQLEKYFTGKQEGVNPKLEFVFKKDVVKSLNTLAVKLIEDIPSIKKKSPQQKINLLEVQAGTIQIDTAYILYKNQPLPGKRPKTNDEHIDWYWSDVYQYYNSEDKKDDNGEDKLENYYEKEGSTLKYILNAFCGIALGIFDFDRMSYEEVNDTLVPRTTTDSYFLILNKSAVTCFCHENKIYETALSQGIGINPYLIIPNTLLSYNSYWTNESEKAIKKYEDKLKNDKKVKNVDTLRSIRDILADTLKYSLPNVYQYETERDLYDYGMDKRGTNEKRVELEIKKKNAEEDITIIANKRAESFSILAIILSIISLSQIYQVSERFYEILSGWLHKKDYILIFSKGQATVTVVAIFLLIFVWLFRYYFKSTSYYINKYEI